MNTFTYYATVTIDIDSINKLLEQNKLLKQNKL